MYLIDYHIHTDCSPDAEDNAMIICCLLYTSPSKGFAHLKFLLKSFVPLTDLLAKYLRPEPEDMKDPEFRAISTRLTLSLIHI